MISSESIKLFRLKNGLTQEKMAELLEISQSSYNRLENDKRELKISDIKIMA
ncbi:MAG: Helix-turn-helix domain, partial [Bacteroidota bacterium]